VPGITIPAEIQKRLADAGSDAKHVGFDLARGLIEDARERAAGIYVIPPFKEPTAALDLLEA
jgi:methionine synthase / methylenetetrahydrofolate reductase (NADH)